jgi:carbamoyltransferase
MGFQSYGKVNKDLLDDLNKNLTLDKIKKLPVNVDAAKTYQVYFENRYQKLVKKFKSSNMVFTGGTALNVVNNYKLKKLFPKTKMYFEPLCGDEGNCIGTVYNHYLNNNQKIKPIENIFLGEQIKINKSLLKDEYLKSNIVSKDIINILNKGEVVGLIQGKAEAGPRALGNRSLLLDPTIKNAKEKMNSIKKRESFRPFACSILEKKFSTFFNVEEKEESPFMMIAPLAKEKTKNIAPSIVHVDGTCRVQTINSKNNFQLNELLKNFKIPILMNTSFNLAGFPIVETFENVLHMLRNSELRYVYFSDEKKLLIKND